MKPTASWLDRSPERAGIGARSPSRSRRSAKRWIPGAPVLLGLLVAPALLGCAASPPIKSQAPVGCGDAPSRPPHDEAAAPRSPSPAAWRKAREDLRDLRRSLLGLKPHTRKLALKLREPLSGRTMEARGAVAIAPPEALRMILLGPGGTTALDLWIRGDRFRFAVPALDLLRRGDASTPRDQMRGLPVDFLRWWLLRPADGTLLWHERLERADHFVLRDGSAIVDLCASDDGSIKARRTTWLSARRGGDPGEPGNPSQPSEPGDPRRRIDEETVVATRAGCGPVRYTQASTGLDISITCEGEELSSAPSPRAFIDPDEPTPDAGDSDQGGGG